MSDSVTFRQRLWRWHFFSGLLVCPFAIVLAITGSIYLFKPQIDRYEESRINALGSEVSGTEAKFTCGGLVSIMLTRYPGTTFKKLILAKDNDRTVEIELQNDKGEVSTYWVDIYSGRALAHKKNNERFLQVVKRIHGELLLGNSGSYFVELMASWFIVLVVTGLYLWLAKPLAERGSHKVIKSLLLPNFKSKKPRKKWFSVHGVVGLWFALPILLLLLSGLPWTQLWGAGFKEVKSWAGWDGPGQEWFVTLQSTAKNKAVKKEFDRALWQINSENDSRSQRLMDGAGYEFALIDTVAEKPDVLNLVPPIYIMPPKSEKGVWSVRSMSQLRSQRVTLHYDQYSGAELMRIDFEDHHPVQRFVSQGISLHEGALFGWLNQFLGLLTALAIITMSVVGFYIWWLRRPKGELSVPKKVTDKFSPGLLIILLCFSVFLPAVGISFMLVCLIEWMWLRVLAKRVV